MREKIKVAPASEGLVLRDPTTFEQIPISGKLVEKNQYWVRRLKAGEAVILKGAVKKTEVKTASKK